MKTGRAVLLTVLLLFGGGVAHAQNDGDHLLTNGFGQSFLAPDAAVPGGLGVLPVNLTVGTAAGLNATLRVRGDQLPVNDAFVGTSLATFRTDVGNGNNQNWSMVRGALEIGRLWHTNPSRRSWCRPASPMATCGSAIPRTMEWWSTSTARPAHS